MGRTPCCDKANVKRGPWSPQEDAALISYIQNHGSSGSWIALPNKAGLNRCGKSCRLRWLNYLRPDIKHGSFTKEEDDLIFTLYSKIGSRWSVIASKLPGRTDNDVKNHWNTKLKKRLIEAQITLSENPYGSSMPPLMASNNDVKNPIDLSFPVQIESQSFNGIFDEPLDFSSLNFGSITDILCVSNYEDTIETIWGNVNEENKVRELSQSVRYLY